MNERRAHVRVPVGIEGTYQLVGDLSGPHLGMTQDISLGGLRFSSGRRLEPGEKVSVQMVLPAEGQVSMIGRVVWSREVQEAGQRNFESGLFWEEIGAPARERLSAFVTEYTRSRSFSISSSGLAGLPRVRWELAVILSLSIFAAGLLLAAQWIERRRLLSEVESLRQAVGLYQEIVRSTHS